MSVLDRLTPTADDLSPFRGVLVPTYIDYCRNVSRRSMAISVETAAYLAWVCATTSPTRTCDLGSGFTSYVLQSFPATATSVDDDPVWLGRTREFLERSGRPVDGLVEWVDWQAGSDTYDLIIHDFARGDLRNTSMWEAAERLNPGGVLIFDDAQHDGHAAEMRKVADFHGWEIVDLHDITVDLVGRFAMGAHA